MAVDLARRTTITSFSTAKTVNLKPPFTIGSPFNSTHEIFINLSWIFAWKMEFLEYRRISKNMPLLLEA